jgi:hypothetical protein
MAQSFVHGSVTSREGGSRKVISFLKIQIGLRGRTLWFFQICFPVKHTGLYRMQKYRNLLEARFVFNPLAFETFEPWGPESKALISTIGRKITEKTGEKRATECLRQQISIEIQRGNAASILNTQSDTRGLDEIFMS